MNPKPVLSQPLSLLLVGVLLIKYLLECLSHTKL